MRVEGRSVGGRGRTKARERGESTAAEGDGGGERWRGGRIGGRERAVDAEEASSTRGSVRGRDFKRNQFGVAVQSNVTLAAAGVNVGRNSNFTPGPR